MMGDAVKKPPSSLPAALLPPGQADLLQGLFQTARGLVPSLAPLVKAVKKTTKNLFNFYLGSDKALVPVCYRLMTGLGWKLGDKHRQLEGGRSAAELWKEVLHFEGDFKWADFCKYAVVHHCTLEGQPWHGVPLLQKFEDAGTLTDLVGAARAALAAAREMDVATMAARLAGEDDGEGEAMEEESVSEHEEDGGSDGEDGDGVANQPGPGQEEAESDKEDGAAPNSYQRPLRKAKAKAAPTLSLTAGRGGGGLPIPSQGQSVERDVASGGGGGKRRRMVSAAQLQQHQQHWHHQQQREETNRVLYRSQLFRRQDGDAWVLWARGLGWKSKGGVIRIPRGLFPPLPGGKMQHL